jgi:glycosyltransferase involved in cell wall biosynthesis
MRIAINAWFVDRPTTGSGQYLTHLLTEYAARHAEHAYLLCIRANQAARPEVIELPCPPFEQQGVRTPFDGRGRHLAKLWFEQVSFPLAARRWGSDLLHVPYWASPLLSPSPAVVTVHDLIPVLLPAYQGGMLGKWYNRLVGLSARRAARVLTDSEASRQDIVRHLRVPPHRVQAILLAAEERFQPIDDAATLSRVRTKYDLPPRYLLYLGGFDVRKNVPGILRAYARFQGAGTDPDVGLVIAGQLPAQESAFTPSPQRIAAEEGLLERVRFTGWVDEEDKPALYSAAIAFTFPSLYEGFGLPPLEAMACGTPVIASDRGSLPEVVGDGGLCVDADDVEAIAQAMGRIVGDVSLRETLREAGLAQARAYGWSRTAQETMEAYRLALGVDGGN